MDNNNSAGDKKPAFAVKVILLVVASLAALVVAAAVATARFIAGMLGKKPKAQQLRPWESRPRSNNPAADRIQARLKQQQQQVAQSEPLATTATPEFPDTVAVGPVPEQGQDRAQVLASTSASDLVGASRVNVVELKAQGDVHVGAMWFYRFDKQGLVKRKLKISNEVLAAMFEKGAYYLSDQQWDGSAEDMERIIKLTAEQALALLATATRRHYQKVAAEASRLGEQAAETANKAGKPRSKPPKQARKATSGNAAAQSGNAAAASGNAAAASAPAVPPQPNYTPPVVTGVAYVPQGVINLQTPTAKAEQAEQPARGVQAGSLNLPVAGETYEGIIAEMGPTKRVGADGSTYTTFGLQLLQSGVQRPFYGNELERELLACGAKLGDRVRVTFMGKHNAGNHGGRALWKNLFKVVKVANGEGTR